MLYLYYHQLKKQDMLQRIQTIWLLLAALVLLGLFIFPYVNYIDLVGLGKRILVTGEYGAVNNEVVKNEGYILQVIAVVILALIPLITIFQFKNRKLQLKLIYAEIILICLFSIWIYFSAMSTLSLISQHINAQNIGAGFFLLPLSVLLLSMAIGGIRKDEKLIKSADRLR